MHQHVPAHRVPAHFHGSGQNSAVSRSQHQLRVLGRRHGSDDYAIVPNSVEQGPGALVRQEEVPSAAASVHQPHTWITTGPDVSNAAMPPAHKSLHHIGGVSHAVPPLLPQAVEPWPDDTVHTSSSGMQPDNADMPLDFVSALGTILHSNVAQERPPGSLQNIARHGLVTSTVQPAPGLVPVPGMLAPQGPLQQVPGSNSLAHDRTLGPAAGLLRERGSAAHHRSLHDGRAGSLVSNAPGTPRGSIMPGSQSSAAVLRTPQSVWAAPRAAGPQLLGPPALSLQASSGTAETSAWPSHLAACNASGMELPAEQAGKVLSSRRAARGQSRQEAAGSYPGAHQDSVGIGPVSIMRPISLNVNDCNSARITHMQVCTSVASSVKLVES